MQHKGSVSLGVVIAVIILAIVAVVVYFQDPQPPVSDTQTQNSVQMREFRDDTIGISFMYPESYGDVTLNIIEQNPQANGPFNVRRIYDTDEGYFDMQNIRHFVGTFSGTDTIEFGGGFVCWGCEGGRYIGDLDFQRPEGYQKVITDSGAEGLVYLGKNTPENPCDPGLAMCFESIRAVYQGMYFVSFKVPTDYWGVTFYVTDTPDNLALLKSVKILPDNGTQTTSQ